MSHLRPVTEGETPEGTLKEMLDRAEHFEMVMVIALNKDGSQCMVSSNGSMHQKSFLLAFAQSWLMQWFHWENA